MAERARQFLIAPSSPSAFGYGDTDQIDDPLNRSETHTGCSRSPSHVPSGSSMTIPPRSTPDPRASLQDPSGCISVEEHERIIRDNLRLSRELNEAKAEAKKAEIDAGLAKCAFRMLAKWAYNERHRLPKDAPDRKNAVEVLELGWRRHTKIGKDSGFEESGNIDSIQDTASDAEEVLSIADQVEQLIEEEKAKLRALYARF
jgi:hypothetical protein